MNLKALLNALAKAPADQLSERLRVLCANCGQSNEEILALFYYIYKMSEDERSCFVGELVNPKYV